MSSRAMSVLFTLSAALSFACGGSQKGNESAAQDGEQVQRSSDEKKWGGWRWKGNVDECFYRFENRCFRERAPACKAAGCPGSDCQSNDGAPAKITCAGDAAKSEGDAKNGDANAGDANDADK